MKSLFLFVLLASSAMAQTLPAFPGAEGGGATSKGGRGGVVYIVNDLSDATHSNCVPANSSTKTKWSGTCSLRDCIQGGGARNCLPSIGGIVKTCSMRVFNGQLTIATQVAPGGGITLVPNCGGPNGLLAVMTNDVVIRYLTAAPGPGSTPGPSSGINCFLVYAGSLRVYWDHVTCRWSDDKPWLANNNGAAGINQVTLGWSLFYKPNVGHPVGVSGGTISGDAKMMNDIDIHHNANFAVGHRVPLEYYTKQRYVSNLNWNWGDYCKSFAGGFQGGMNADLINNKYVAGNFNAALCAAWALPFQFQQPVSDDVNAPPQNDLVWTGKQYYLKGNVGPQMTNPNGDQTLLTSFNTGDMESGHPDPTSPAPASAFRTTPLPTLPFPITETPANALDDTILGTVGNSQGIDCSGKWVFRRDQPDTDIINGYKTNAVEWFYAASGHPLDQQPPVAATSAALPACSIDVDGLPIPYKQANGLAVGSFAANNIASNGETVLNNLLAGNGSIVPPPVTPTWTAGEAVVINAHGAASSKNAWTSLNPSSGPLPFALGDTATIVTGAIVMQNGWPYVQVHFTSGASSGKNGYVGADWIDPATTPPIVVTGVTPLCPATATIGTAFGCTATVQPSTANQAVTWTPAMPYTPTTTGPMTATATSVADPTKSGSANVQVNGITPPPTCPVVNGTFASTVPVAVLIGGVAVPVVNVNFTCNYTFDPNTNTMTVTGCH